MRIIEDLKRYSGGSVVKACYHIFLNSNFQMIFWYRIAHGFSKMHLSFISKIIMYFHKLIYTCDIDYRANIAGGFKIVHGLGLVIGSGCVIEENVTLYQQVTLGGNMGKCKEIKGNIMTQPYLHKNVIIAAKATVIGPCEIGNGSMIGAGAIITSDIPSETTVYTKAQRIEISHKIVSECPMNKEGQNGV